MNRVPRVFRRFIPQLLHMFILPVFFFAFMLVYHPFDIVDFIGKEWFGVHLTIVSCIIFLSSVLSRLLYYFLPLSINYSLYSVWCLAEIIFMSFFSALYIWLVLHRPVPYFETLTLAFKYISLTLVFPYVILAISMRLADFNRSANESEEESSRRMRFYDEKHNLKIVLLAQSVLYIEADVNYVNIYYTDNGKVRKYVLRSSMKAIDELCQENGLLRCQRSYYVNPQHVKVLRKEREGIIYAELDAAEIMRIPVTKRYYDRLAEMLY